MTFQKRVDVFLATGCASRSQLLLLNIRAFRSCKSTAPFFVSAVRPFPTIFFFNCYTFTCMSFYQVHFFQPSHKQIGATCHIIALPVRMCLTQRVTLCALQFEHV